MNKDQISVIQDIKTRALEREANRLEKKYGKKATKRIKELIGMGPGGLVQLLECPFMIDDLVLSDSLTKMLNDFIFEARDRKQLWENKKIRRLFPTGRGMIGLLSGPGGTGKTMTARIIASELSLDLYRIDLAMVLNKYLGETQKSLDNILSWAEGQDILLFFDEADALFGKRSEVSDAHDRYANIETNFLINSIEKYNGLALLATNVKSNIDSAFIRRLRYVLDFPMPEAEERYQIWKKISNEIIEEKDNKEEIQRKLKIIAEKIDLSGSQIKASLLLAKLIALKDEESLSVNHIIQGVEVELIKEGQSLSKEEIDILQ